MITQVLWASMVDFPGHTCAVLFVDKCNFNCAYCYNKNLKNKKALDFDKQILPKLKERQDFVNHVIISGGEPTQDIQFEYILDKLNEAGFIVGIHTNGYNPEIIKLVREHVSELTSNLSYSTNNLKDAIKNSYRLKYNTFSNVKGLTGASERLSAIFDKYF